MKPTPPPSPPPPPYEPTAHLIITGELDPVTGDLTISPLECAEFFPGFLAIEVELVATLPKGGGPISGSTIYTEDFTAPFDCVDGTQYTGPLTLTPLAQSHDEDVWGAGPAETGPDGCSTWEELGTDQSLGGLRDPFNFWDFYDVPTGSPPTRDGGVFGQDVNAVSARFGSSGDPTGDPLSSPPPAPAYHTAYDRGPAVGQNAWNLGPPDGSIFGQDLSAVVAQFGHSCAAAP